MFLYKKIIDRLPYVEQVRCQNLNEDSLLSMNNGTNETFNTHILTRANVSHES